MKRAISWIIALCLVLSVFPAGVLAAEPLASGTCGESLNWVLYDSGLLEITGSGEMDYFTYNSDVPWYEYMDQITSVSFPEGLLLISAFAFDGCTGLTELILPESLVNINGSAFAGCTGLTEVEIPDSCTSTLYRVFSECENLERVKLSVGMTGIGAGAFYFCRKLQSIEIPEGVTYIGDDAFYYCTSMTEVVFPESLTAIREGAFGYCTSIAELNLPAALESIGRDAFFGCCGMEELILPDGVEVGRGAFTGGNFTKLYIPDNVYNLGPYAFENCDGITRVTIPSSISAIQSGLFYDCDALVDVTIPETITSIYSYAFSGCDSLKYMEIPTSVRSLGAYTFARLTDAGIRFLGSAPAFDANTFYKTTATCYYPVDDGSWTEEIRQQYGGTVTWIPVTACETGHTWRSTVFAPTCTEQGYTLRTCLLCGETEMTDYEDALGHDWCDWVISQEPSCVGTGVRCRCCSICDERQSEDIPANGHRMGEWVTEREPGCVSSGSAYRRCGICNYTERQTIEAPGHEMGEWTILREPDCGSTGTRMRSCINCDHFETEQLPRLEHDYLTEVVEPTCSERGYTIDTCRLCGTTNKYDYTEKIDHSFGEWTVWEAPTCMDPGREGRSCVCCGCPESVMIPALGHNWQETVVGPSCTAPGRIAFLCLNCGERGEEPNGDALGHDYENGLCSRCGDKLDSSFCDVDPGSFYFDPVVWAVGSGITTGTGDGTFSPDRTCLRAQAVTFLWRAEGCPEPESAENPFVDITESDFYYKAVLWAVEQGITNGISTDRFGPFETCSRAQVVTFLWRTKGMPGQSGSCAFSDVIPGSWYHQPVLWALNQGITGGMGDGSFGVTLPRNRAQMATFLYRAYT